MKVFCIKSNEVERIGLIVPTIYAGVWYEAETNSRENPSLGSYLINGWWYDSKLFITKQEFRDKKLTELGI